MLDRLTDNEMADVAAVIEKTAVGAFRLYNYIHQRNKEAERTKLLQRKSNENMFVFKGNIYDLSYFWGREKLQISDLETIPEGIRSAVKDNFNHLAQEGLVELTFDKKALILTEEGKKCCNDKNFIKAVCEDRIDVCNNIKKVIVDENLHRKIKNEINAATADKNIPNTPTINFNDNLVNNTNEILHEMAKKSTDKVVEKGANEVVKSAAKASVGVATAGVGTAAQIAYDLAMGGVKVLENKIIK